MFLQIKLKRQDQNTHRFSWRDLQTNCKPDVYCMTRVTLGDTPSPFLSIATIQKHAKEHENKYPKAAEEKQQVLWKMKVHCSYRKIYKVSSQKVDLN